MTEQPAAKKLSGPTLARLPQYLRYLEALHADGVSDVTSAQLAEVLGVSDALTRKDVSALGHSGRAGRGYSVEALRYTIARILGSPVVVECYWSVQEISVPHCCPIRVSVTGA